MYIHIYADLPVNYIYTHTYIYIYYIYNIHNMYNIHVFMLYIIHKSIYNLVSLL